MATAATDPANSSTPPTAVLPPPFDTSPDPLTLITQGAEARVYKTTFLTPSTPAVLKVRPTKPWRHPTLDRRLTRQRILAEARALVRCAQEGVRVPAVLALDWERGWMVCEWIAGRTVKEAIRARTRDGEEDEKALRGLLARVGGAVGALHAVGIIHGDLTTSNMMLRPVAGDGRAGDLHDPARAGGGGDGGTSDLEGDIVLIDFGLATQGVQGEDRAVDLYVLERAFGSTHPREEELFADVVLHAYGESYPGAKSTLRRLEDVRMRGRKKSMIG